MHYKTRLTWTGNRGAGTASYTEYGREYVAVMDGKPDFHGTADPKFRGDATQHNPEDLLVIALSGCHMLSYLALCARAGIVVLEYSDDASGTLVLKPGGGGHFEEVTLRPDVRLADERDTDRANELHETAHRQCFIASSCNFPVHHRATVRADAPSAAPSEGAQS